MAMTLPIGTSPVASTQDAGKASATSSALSTNSDSSTSDFASVYAAVSPAVNPAPPAKPVAVKSQSNNGSDSSVAQLTALLQSGVPIPTIIDRIASTVSAAVQRSLPTSAASASGQIRAAVSQSLTNALSPPSNAPPGSAAQEAAALAARLKQWLNGIAGAAEEGAGQQSDTSGQVLDANSARELPAQLGQQPISNDLSFDPTRIAQSLLSTVAASLSPPVSSTLGSDKSATASATSPSPTAAPAAEQTTSISMSNAPDLLARMIVRAAGADAQLNPPPAAPGSDAQTASIPSASTDGSQTLTPAALAARFAAALAEIIAPASSSSPSPNGGGATWNGPDLTNGRTSLTAATSVIPTAAVSSSFDATMAGLSQGSPASASTQTQNSPATAPNAPLFDPTPIIEQVVASMTMRTAQDGTSEMRLHLNPSELGEVSMKLTVQGSNISANVMTQNAAVRSALMDNQQQLARSLNQAGLTLSGFSVDVSGGNAGNGGNQGRASGFGRRYTIHELPGSEESEQAANSGAIPPLVGGSTLELFNYLV